MEVAPELEHLPVFRAAQSFSDFRVAEFLCCDGNGRAIINPVQCFKGTLNAVLLKPDH
jgi:hypothetical protein